MIELVSEGVLYRNPFPMIRSRHAWHPTLVDLGGGEWVCAFDLAEAAEAHDYGTHVSVSHNDAATWSTPERIVPVGEPPRSTTLRLSRLRDGSLLFAGAHHHARSENQGRLNPSTFGYIDMDLVTVGGSPGNWDAPAIVDPPLAGTPFETCHSVLELSDGRLVLPTCTWMNWDGSAPHGMKGVLLVSHDHGATWPEAITTMDAWERRVTHFEQSVVELDDGALLAIAWAYNVDTGATEPTPYAIAPDGQNFTHHGLTGLNAQTAKLLHLGGNRLLCAYRRHDERGLWIAEVEIVGTEWRTISTRSLWNGAASGMAGERAASEELSGLRFGFPQMVLRSDGDVQLVFWARADDVNEIRWLRLAVDR